MGNRVAQLAEFCNGLGSGYPPTLTGPSTKRADRFCFATASVGADTKLAIKPFLTRMSRFARSVVVAAGEFLDARELAGSIYPIIPNP